MSDSETIEIKKRGPKSTLTPEEKYQKHIKYVSKWISNKQHNDPEFAAKRKIWNKNTYERRKENLKIKMDRLEELEAKEKEREKNNQ